MLYFNDPPLVRPSLLELMFPVASCSRRFSIRGCVRVKHFYVKVCTTPTAIPKFCAFTSSLAPSSVLAIGKRSRLVVHELLLQFFTNFRQTRNMGGDLRWLVPSPLDSFKRNELT